MKHLGNFFETFKKKVSNNRDGRAGLKLENNIENLRKKVSDSHDTCAGWTIIGTPVHRNDPSRVT